MRRLTTARPATRSSPRLSRVNAGCIATPTKRSPDTERAEQPPAPTSRSIAPTSEGASHRPRTPTSHQPANNESPQVGDPPPRRIGDDAGMATELLTSFSDQLA